VILLHRLLQDSLRQSTNRFRVAMRQLLERVQFTLRHLDLTRIQRAEVYDLAELRLAARQASIAGHRMALWLAAYSRIQQGLLTMTGVGVLLAGGYLVMRSDITMGSLISFYVVVGMLSSYIREAISAISQILAGLESLKALTGFIDLQAELPYQGKGILEHVGALDLCGVSFAYDERTILQQIDLRLESGKITAVVGPNGSGKSTIIHLLLGFYRPTNGALCAGGIPYDELDVAALRSHFGVVVQDPILFAGSVKNNILYGLQDVSNERLLEAARMATVDEFVQLLPEGYATQVGEQGIKLSGGQRQRLAIARALVRKPHFLILDEPTNHLDVDAIRRIAESIRQLDHAPAILLVSHDEAVIRMADEVLQLTDGRLHTVAANTQRSDMPQIPEGQYS
jgi:ATP-binding cassette subfamily B protein